MTDSRYFLTDDKYLVVDRYMFNIKLNRHFISPDMERIFEKYWSYVITTNTYFSGKVVPYSKDDFYKIVAELLKNEGDTYHTEGHLRESFKDWSVTLLEFLLESVKNNKTGTKKCERKYR